jgi:hypothetical protein
MARVGTVLPFSSGGMDTQDQLTETSPSLDAVEDFVDKRIYSSLCAWQAVDIIDR